MILGQQQVKVVSLVTCAILIFLPLCPSISSSIYIYLSLCFYLTLSHCVGLFLFSHPYFSVFYTLLTHFFSLPLPFTFLSFLSLFYLSSPTCLFHLCFRLSIFSFHSFISSTICLLFLCIYDSYLYAFHASFLLTDSLPSLVHTCLLLPLMNLLQLHLTSLDPMYISITLIFHTSALPVYLVISVPGALFTCLALPFN